MLKLSALLAISTILLVVTATLASTVILLSPPGHGFPALSKNQPVKPLNTEMIAALADEKYFLKRKSALAIKNNRQKKTYASSYALPDKTFDIMCHLSVERGAIHVAAGNIEFVVSPSRTGIYQDGKLIKTHEGKGIRGVGFERGYDSNRKLGSIARIHSDGYAPGAEVKILFPAMISVSVIPNTIGSIGNWEWVRGPK